MRAFDADRKTYAPERLLAFSDAVMAVAITLLVLDLKLPEGVSDADLGAVLRGSLHGVGVYALSFVVIGLFWMGHHQQFSNIRRVDGPLMWLNLLFLMTIGLIPFVTSILSDHGDELPTMLYAGVLVAACLVSAALVRAPRSRAHAGRRAPIYAARGARHAAAHRARVRTFDPHRLLLEPRRRPVDLAAGAAGEPRRRVARQLSGPGPLAP